MKNYSIFFALFIFIFLAACQPGNSTSADSQSVSSGDGSSASDNSALLGSVSYKLTGQSPDYVLKVETPALRDSSAPHAADFGQAVTRVIQQEVENFKKSLPSGSGSGESSFDLRYKLISPPGAIISLQFRISENLAGAAQSTNRTVSFNYDLNQGQVIDLGHLFLPGANYLQLIAADCKSELGKRGIVLDANQHGADPTPENYRNWNLSSAGLVVTFDEGQVAPPAAGSQAVVIPEEVFKQIVKPQGPLADFIK